MTEYTIRVPVTGYIDVAVVADTEGAAIDKALNVVFSVETHDPNDEPGTFETHRRVYDGNACRASCAELQVLSADDTD